MADFFAQPGRDGRRKTNPLTRLDGAPAMSPDWQLVRVRGAVDAAFTNRGDGINCRTHHKIRINTVPYDDDPSRVDGAAAGGDANAAIEVRLWSEASQSFVPFDTPVTKAAGGAGIPMMIDVELANAGVIGVFLTSFAGTGTNTVAIFAQGFDIHHP